MAVNLAKLHKTMRKVPLSPEMAEKYTYGDTKMVLEKHCREMRSIRNYMKGCRQKKAFENLYLEYYEIFARQARDAVNALDDHDYRQLAERTRQEHTLCHGDYNHHNVIIMKGQTRERMAQDGHCLPVMATVNFDRMHINIQVNDLYLFLRKVMEKNSWNVDLGISLVNAYDRERPMSREEKKYLYILMLFPEKFWKIANHYYNTRKAGSAAVIRKNWKHLSISGRCGSISWNAFIKNMAKLKITSLRPVRNRRLAQQKHLKSAHFLLKMAPFRCFAPHKVINSHEGMKFMTFYRW